MLDSLWSDSSCSIFSDTGFDPLGLADTPEALVRVAAGTLRARSRASHVISSHLPQQERFTESELIHCRFASA